METRGLEFWLLMVCGAKDILSSWFPTYWHELLYQYCDIRITSLKNELKLVMVIKVFISGLSCKITLIVGEGNSSHPPYNPASVARYINRLNQFSGSPICAFSTKAAKNKTINHEINFTDSNTSISCRYHCGSVGCYWVQPIFPVAVSSFSESS